MTVKVTSTLVCDRCGWSANWPSSEHPNASVLPEGWTALLREVHLCPWCSSVFHDEFMRAGAPMS